MIPQLICIAFVIIALARAVYLHGKPMKGDHDFRDALIGIAIGQGLLLWGGFYEVLL